MTTLQEEQDKATRRAKALQRISEIYPDAWTAYDSIVSPSLLLADAGPIVPTEANGWPAFYVMRDVEGVQVRTKVFRFYDVLKWLRENQPEALQAAMAALGGS